MRRKMHLASVVLFVIFTTFAAVMYTGGRVDAAIPARAAEAVSANVTFQADMTDLLALAFDPVTDEMRVTGDFNNWVNNADYALKPDGADPTKYAFTVRITAAIDSTIDWKFQGYPGDEFVNSGLESAATTLEFSGRDTVLALRKPNLTYLQYIKLIAPNGGEQVRAGTTKKIAWSTHITGNVLLEYQTSAGGAWTTITASTPALTEYYSWVVPVIESSDCRVRVASLTDGAIADTSAAVFSITQAVPTTESESNNTGTTGNWLEYGDAVDAAITPEGDVDYYRFWGAKGDSVEIWGHYRVDSLGARIWLYKADGSFLIENGGYLMRPLDQRITLVLPSDGIYYIRYAYEQNWGAFPNRDLIGNPEEPDETAQLLVYSTGGYSLGIRLFQSAGPVICDLGYFSVFSTSAKLYASLDPNGLSTEASFEYGTTNSFGQTAVAKGSPFKWISPQWVSSDYIEGLSPDTRYYVRMQAHNALGSDTSEVVALYTAPLSPGWVRISADTIANFTDVAFTNDTLGVIVGENIILRTEDGGEKWEPVYNGSYIKFEEVVFSSPDTCFAIGGYGNIFRSIDGGENWSQINTGLTYLSGGFFLNETVGWVVGNESTIGSISSSGISWTEEAGGTSEPLMDVHFFDANTGLVVGWNTTVLRTTDGGSSWTALTGVPAGSYYAVDFATDQIGIMVGYPGIICRTTDGGATWTQIAISSEYDPRDVLFLDANRGIAVGRFGKILVTTDGGLTWSPQESGTKNDLLGLTHAGSHTTIIGDKQTILRSVGYLALKSPVGGESWNADGTYDIEWWTDLDGEVKLEYRTSSTSGWLPIIANTPAFTCTHTWTLPHIESDSCKVRITSLASGALVDESDVFSIKPAPITQQVINLIAGWNLISSYIDPPDSTLPTLLLAPLGSHLTIVKNNLGNIYYPSNNTNTIGNWEPLEGYKCYLTEADVLTFDGVQLLPESTPISLPQGWNMVAYLRSSALTAPTALASISGSLTIAKNMAGQVYWPTYNINSIGDLLPGQGYQLYLTAAATLTYPANTLPKEPLTAIQVKIPQHFQIASQFTGNSAILLVKSPALQDMDEVAVYGSDQRCLGAGVAQTGQALVTIWGDDGLTKAVDGARDGEKLELACWSATTKTETPLQVASLLDGLKGTVLAGTLVYQNNAVLVAEVSGLTLLPKEFALRQNYPNPFNPVTNIRYELPKNSRMELIIYNLRGQIIRILMEGEEKAGYHEVEWDGRNQTGEPAASGLYLVRMKAGSYRKVIKMSLIK